MGAGFQIRGVPGRVAVPIDSNAQQKSVLGRVEDVKKFLNTTHGSGWIFQVQPT
jgi:hypothetical protein